MLCHMVAIFLAHQKQHIMLSGEELRLLLLRNVFGLILLHSMFLSNRS